MPRPPLRAVTAAVTFALAALVPAATTSSAAPVATHSHHIVVPMGSAGFSLPATAPAGWVSFTAYTDDPVGHQLEGFRTRNGATAEQVVEDIKQAVSFDPATSVAGTAATRRDAELVGGPSVDPTTPVTVTIELSAGTYYFFDFDDFFTPEQQVTLHTMRVAGVAGSGGSGADARGAAASVVETMVDDQPRFLTSSGLPARGTIRMVNAADELHEVLLQRVRPGTTDAQVQAYYESGSPSDALYAVEPPLRGVAAMDPGRVAYVRFDRLPAGTYALLCFVPDDETGLPHVVEGMHAVVTMR